MQRYVQKDGMQRRVGGYHSSIAVMKLMPMWTKADNGVMME
jgi:hypothetical protein